MKSSNSLVENVDISVELDKTVSKMIDHVEVEVEVLLGNMQVTVAELNKIKNGTVLEVDRYISEAADIRVNGHIIGRGEIVTVGRKFAIRVTQIGD